METREKKILRKYLEDGESIYMIDMAYPGWPIFVIGPQIENKKNPGYYLDLDRCIRTTLYRLIEDGEEEEAENILMAEKVSYNDPNCFDEDGNPVSSLHRIDLRYGIFNFYPLSVKWVEDYEDPEDKKTA